MRGFVGRDTLAPAVLQPPAPCASRADRLPGRGVAVTVLSGPA